MGDCNFCGKKAGFMRGKHKECEATNVAGRREMVSLAAQAAAAPDFNEAVLQRSLAAIAQRSWVDQDGIHAAIAAGWHQAVKESLADGILTQDEEARLRAFRDRLALEQSGTAQRRYRPTGPRFPGPPDAGRPLSRPGRGRRRDPPPGTGLAA